MYDASLLFLEPARRHARVLETLGLRPGEFVLATVHRAENTDVAERLDNIFAALAELAQDIEVVVPLHPRTRKILASRGWKAPRRLRLVDPVGFLDMLMLERNARVIATDSGGVQKEAYFYGVPCVTLRDETEWVELVRVGANRLAPPADRAGIVAALREGMRRGRLDENRAQLYGDGHASERIASILAGKGALNDRR
jgi:UDP-GlcNAc3NAcA epimerase